MTDRRHTEPIDVSGRRATDLIPTTLEKQEERMDRLEDAIIEIRDILKPISQTYTSASQIGKWMTATAVFVSIVIGVVLGIIKIVHTVKK